MRQLMTLADRGWTDLDTVAKLIFGGWKRYGSALLLMAILLNVLGKYVRRESFPYLRYILTTMQEE